MSGAATPTVGGHVGSAYRPEIDGLRAVAVLAVVIFHLDEDWLSGGFVGVDVFFVISGFLITSMLVTEAAHGQISLRRFFQRRIARIFPLFFVVAATTVLGARLVYTEQDYASAGSSLAAAAVSLANVKYMVQGSYFAISEDAQPLLHYWSLSVEEQFYLLYPGVLWLAYRRRIRPRTLAVVLGVVMLASTALNVVVSRFEPTWAFYLLPTRGWALVAGALLAVASVEFPARMSALSSAWTVPAGLFLIVASFFVIDGPSGLVRLGLFPVVGTCLVIAGAKDSGGPAVRLLSHDLPVQVGLHSYALYLWHWPVFSLIDYRFYEAGGLIRLAAKLTVTLTLALVSHRLIERPARRCCSRHRRLHLATLGSSAFTGSAVGSGDVWGGHSKLGPPSRLSGRSTVPGPRDASGIGLRGRAMETTCTELC